MTYKTVPDGAERGVHPISFFRFRTCRSILASLFLTAAVAASAGGCAVTPTLAQEAPASAAAAGGGDAGSAEAGKAIYDSVGCSSCHGVEGEGVVAPKLVGSRTAANINTLVQRILYGGGDMPPFNQLSDEEIAGVANYVRTGFNKHSQLVKPEDVAAAR